MRGSPWEHGTVVTPLPRRPDEDPHIAATPAPAPAPRPPGLGSLDAPLARLGLTRAPEDQVVSGVAAGIAARLGVDPGVVRLAFVVLATAGGFGVALYAVARALLPEAEGASPAARHPAAGRRAVGVGLVLAGVMLLCRTVGLWFGDTLAVPVALAAVGSAVVWTRAAEDERRRWRTALEDAVGDRRLPDLARVGPIRLAVGLTLALAGVVVFLVTTDAGAVPDVLLASAVTLAGVALVVGPWLQDLGAQVARERRERIRVEERADMAAHLHDSVLQTLALIQRAGSPEEMARLARGQERELRAWLFGRRPDDAPTRLGEALRDAAGRVEDRYGVVVDVVLAGDLPLDEHLWAVAAAASEAMANAGAHAGVSRVDVFAEVEPGGVVVYVRDEGRGFDTAAVPDDRRGVRESITGRMARHGGSATVVSAVGEGTEVELRLPASRLTTGGDEGDEGHEEEQDR